MKEYFLKLYRYNAWSDDRVATCLARQNVSHEKVLSLMGHLVAAQFIWLHRIKGLPPPELKLWDSYKLPDLITLTKGAGKQWIDYVESTDNFNRELKYTNYVGDPYVNNVESIMIHLVNHSTYHRGQIALLLRENGLEPINTDFITYDRVVRGQLKE